MRDKILKILLPNKKIKIKYDRKKLNGTPRKVMNVDLAKKYGWTSKINFNEGILKTYNSYTKKNKLDDA